MVNQILYQIIKMTFNIDCLNRMENHLLTQRKDKENKDKIAQNIHNYLQNRVMPILAPLQIAALQQQPQDVSRFCLQMLKSSKPMQMNQNLNKQIQNQQIPQEIFRDQVRQKIKKQRKGSRQGIVGDRPKQGFIAIGKDYLSKGTYQHTEQDKVKLIMYLKKCMFFQHLSTSQLIKIVQRMKIVQFDGQDVIIQQGQKGNQLFVVDSGLLKCEKEGQDQILRYYTKGQMFGQLSLLYNNPRATTVTAIEKGRLFSLERPYFSAILHLGVNQKLKQCQQLVDKIDIFDSLNIYQKTKLYESMQLKKVGPDKYIIKEGQQGTCFYIVAEGQLVAYKQKKTENKLVYVYKKGDYFGQIALLKNLPRQASVKTCSDVRLYFINRQAFSRILGPLESILRRNQERYTKWAQELQK